MWLIRQSTARPLLIKMVDETDGKTPEPGLTLTVTVRKAGGSWAAAAGSVADRGNGSYEYTPTSGEVDTVGVFEWRATATGAWPFDGAGQVCSGQFPDSVSVSSISNGTISSATLASGTITSSKFGAGAIDATALADGAITAAKLGTGAITSAKFAAGAIDAAAVADGAIDAGAIADGSIIASKIGGNAITSAKIASGAITAAAFATDAIDANAVAASAVTELQSGLATAAAVQGVQDDTNDIQARLPAALVGGRIDASVGAMAVDVVTASALASSATAEIATAVAAPDTAAIASAVDAALSTSHGAGAWEGSGGATAGEIADAVLDEALAGHATAGTVGEALSGAATGAAVAALPAAVWADATGQATAARVASMLPAYVLDDNIARNGAGLPTSARRRFYASAAHLAAATAGGALTGNEVATVTMTWSYSSDLVTSQRGAP